MHRPIPRPRLLWWLAPRCECGKWWNQCRDARHGVAGNYTRRWP